MEQITVKVPDDTNESLEEIADEEYGGNRSDAIRALLEKGLDYDEVEAERDRLQRQLAATNARQDDVRELVEYVEAERDLQRRREERRDAPAWRRAKWWLLGRSRG